MNGKPFLVIRLGIIAGLLMIFRPKYRRDQLLFSHKQRAGVDG